MRQFVYDSWQGVMNAEFSPLKNIKDMQVRHLALQALAWMWCIAFSVMFETIQSLWMYVVNAHYIMYIDRVTMGFIC